MQQNMLDSLDHGKKNKKKKSKVPPHVLNMGSPELSELGDTAFFRNEPIHIEFSAKEPSAEDRRFADVIRFKLACEAELKMSERIVRLEIPLSMHPTINKIARVSIILHYFLVVGCSVERLRDMMNSTT